MNILDRMIVAVAPERGMRRLAARRTMQVLNFGYGEGGASHNKKSMRGWQTWPAGPREDIDLNLPTLRARCRDLWMNSPIGRSAQVTTRTNVVGSGLRLKSRLDIAVLGLTEEQADAWEQQTEREFNLWAESEFCDALRLNNFYELQQLAQLGWLMNGDSFCLFKQAATSPLMPYSLRLHLLEADRISTPYQLTAEAVPFWLLEGTAPNGNRIISGVEIDDSGATVAYWICNQYPTYYISMEPLKWTRVDAFGAETGERQIIHLMESERAEQRRGVPFLAPVIECLKQITRYTEAELMASVVSGMFTVFVKTEGPTSQVPLGSMVSENEKLHPTAEPAAYEMGNGAINVLAPGESIESANPGRPNSNFDGFINALAAQIGAALEIPKELLLKMFNASYSASRAALLEAWKMFRMRRTWLANDFCQPIYERWLSEAVARGRIFAPGFWSDPLIRKAWCRCDWNGPSPGQIDPLKEVQAATARVAGGFSTREREAIELNGSDFDRNIGQLKRENELMKGAGLNVQSSSTGAGTGTAAGNPGEDPSGGGDGSGATGPPVDGAGK